MPKTRQRKSPVTSFVSGKTSSSTPQLSRTVIRQFHLLLKRRAQLQSAQTQNAKALEDIEGQIAQLGGLERYQRMSAAGQGKDRGGGSETILIKWLKVLGLNNLKKGQAKLQLLDVGALTPHNYKTCSSWINPTPIDLHSRHPSILKQDFLLLDETEHRGKWDSISLSLVLNFVPDARDRGRMLRLAYNILSKDGHLFVALPLPCVANSRYLNFAHLKALMEAVGFLELKCRWRREGKMVYWLYQKWQDPPLAHDENFGKKILLCQGNRNNFCILL